MILLNNIVITTHKVWIMSPEKFLGQFSFFSFFLSLRYDIFESDK